MKKCCICAHKSRTEIDQEIIRGTSLRTIAKQFGATKSSLYDHQKAGHISASVAKAEEARQIANGEDLLKWTKGLLSKSISYMNKAETAGDLRTAISAIREARGCVELLGQVTGELNARNQTAVQVNVGVQTITTSPEWPVLMRILSKHPEIHAELLAALEEAGI
ncbi:MAG: hypothetical protein WCA60_04090 [Methanoregula sp.]|jgi:hypothetical protein